MKRRRNIIGGATFDEWVSLIGFFVCPACAYIVYWYCLNISILFWILIFIFILLGITLFMSITGVLIDLENKQVKSYIHCLFFKWGTWKSINEVERMVLEYTREGGRIKYGIAPIASGSVHTEYFSISLRFFSGEKIFIKEFSNYEKAKEFLDTYSELLQIEKRDRYEYMLSEIAKIR